MTKNQKIILAAAVLIGGGYFAYKSGLFSRKAGGSFVDTSDDSSVNTAAPAGSGTAYTNTGSGAGANNISPVTAVSDNAGQQVQYKTAVYSPAPDINYINTSGASAAVGGY